MYVCIYLYKAAQELEMIFLRKSETIEQAGWYNGNIKDIEKMYSVRLSWIFSVSPDFLIWGFETGGILQNFQPLSIYNHRSTSIFK
jgi:hypothetical protein